MSGSTDSLIWGGIIGLGAVVIVGGTALLIREHNSDVKLAQDIARQRTRLAYMVPSTLEGMAPAHTIGRPHSDPYYSSSHEVWGSGPWSHRTPRYSYR
jgi:hypothetical protein